MNQKTSKSNTSGVTGVHWHTINSNWFVRIKVEGKIIHIGCFDDFDDAVAARHDAEDKYFGEYSRRASRGDHYKEPDPERMKQLWG